MTRVQLHLGAGSVLLHVHQLALEDPFHRHVAPQRLHVRGQRRQALVDRAEHPAACRGRRGRDRRGGGRRGLSPGRLPRARGDQERACHRPMPHRPAHHVGHPPAPLCVSGNTRPVGASVMPPCAACPCATPPRAAWIHFIAHIASRRYGRCQERVHICTTHPCNRRRAPRLDTSTTEPLRSRAPVPV